MLFGGKYKYKKEENVKKPVEKTTDKDEIELRRLK
jgi:hypothetical protein